MSRYAVALIDESRCIGCTKCLAVCPVDAIIGADQLMHTVITAECIGCALCLPPCPVDCIEMQPVAHKPYDSVLARSRARARRTRLAGAAQQLIEARQRSRTADPVAAALARARKT